MRKYMGVIAAAVTAVISAPLTAEEIPVKIGGLVEVEAGSAEDYAGAKSNDVVLAKVELALEAKLSERVAATVSFLYEEDSTDFSLDEGNIRLQLNDALSLTGGRVHLPFGSFESYMVTDPLTLQLGETFESVVMLSGESNGLYGSAYLFNGDSDKADTVSNGDDDILSYGLDFAYAREESFAIGVGYISNFGDSNALQELETTGASLGVVDKPVPGANLHLLATFGPVTLIGEHMRALDSFANGDLDGSVSNEEQPRASHLELAYAATDSITLAASYQCTREALFTGLPETFTGVTVAYEVMDGAILKAEYATMKDYSTDDGGSGESANTLTLQLAVEF